MVVAGGDVGATFWSMKELSGGGQLGYQASLIPHAEQSSLGAVFQKLLVKDRLGVSVEGGLLYGRLGIPIIAPVSPEEKSWFYLRPSAGTPGLGFIHLPVGLHTETPDGMQVNVEAGLHLLGYYGTSVPYVAAGMGKRF